MEANLDPRGHSKKEPQRRIKLRKTQKSGYTHQPIVSRHNKLG